jgi:hypothetical protein
MVDDKIFLKKSMNGHFNIEQKKKKIPWNSINRAKFSKTETIIMD